MMKVKIEKGKVRNEKLKLKREKCLRLVLCAALFFTFHFSLITLTSCRIEPPLHLPQEQVEINLPIVITDLEAVWETEADWLAEWWYGWDETDVQQWGKLEYPEPTYFEVRRFYQGVSQLPTHSFADGFTIYGNSFRRRYDYGYYDLHVWSNIDSPDGTQTVLIDEADIDNIIGSTTTTRTSYARQPSRVVPLKNQPEIFYNGYERSFYISQNPLDYDYFDETEQAYVKLLKMTLDPVVYVYLVQVVIYNNKGRIRGLADNATMTNMAEGVNLTTGHTLFSNVDVVYAMRMKNGLKARDDRPADILGGKFTTFGLCDMEPWRVSRGPQYAGSRADLVNNVLLDLQFSNQSDKLFTYDVTKQVQRQSHGGVITIEIDADTITVPQSGSSAGAGFNPTVAPGDSVIHEFPI